MPTTVTDNSRSQLADVSDAFVHRALRSSGAQAVPKLSSGAANFSNLTLINTARACLEIDGFDCGRLSNEQVAKAALGFTRQAGINQRSGTPAYHTSGSFEYILADAVNKSLRLGYTEAAQTWRGPMRQAESARDFKTIHRVQVGGAPNVPVWPDNDVPTPASFGNEEVTYAVEAYAQELSFSWRCIVNDDLDALAKSPRRLGQAFARTVNAAAWAQITANPTMPDGQALFLETAAGNRYQTNYLTTASATPSVANVGALAALMRRVRGLNTPENNQSDDILNLSPKYLVVPATLEITALQLVNSIADPAANLSAGVHNPSRSLVVVTEPILDSSSTTAWYLFADPAVVDTVEVTFLQGQEEPVTNDFVDERTMAKVFVGIQTFAAKVIDWRGIACQSGA